MRNHIQIGDRFKKVGIAEKTWIAVRLVDIPDLPQHVYLMNENDDLEMQTLSSVALADKRLYHKAN